MKTLKILDEKTQEESIYYLPDKWDELNVKQLLFLIKLVNKEISAEEIKLKMFLFCLKARIRKINKDASFCIKIKKKRFNLNSEELFVIGSIFDYLFTKGDEIQINPQLRCNPFHIIKFGWIKLYGPADGFTNYSYEDFMKLQISQSNIDDSKAKIRDFISSFYKRKNGKISRLFRFVSNEKVIALLWFYLGCMNFLQDRFPLVFSGGEASKDVVDGQMRIVDALSKNDVTKKKLVRSSDLYEALYTMQIAAEENERLRNNK